MHSPVKEFLLETWTNPVFGDTFAKKQSTTRLVWAEQFLDAIAPSLSAQLSAAVSRGMPEWNKAIITRVIDGEVRDKTIGFSAALTVGEISDLQPLIDLCVAVGLMYTIDQTIDRGSESMAKAVEVFGNHVTPSNQGDDSERRILARTTMLHCINEKIDDLARREDASFVKDCFIDQVLKNEAVMYRLSRNYESGDDTERKTFLAEHARALADITTVTAGFPSISSSLYAIYRRRDPVSLPPLTEVYASPDMVDLLQICNVIVRIWDELGDYEMDSGSHPDKGIFTLNPFNQYHPSTIERYCELAFITDPKQINAIQKAFAEFNENHATRQEHTLFILEVLCDHIRQYMTMLKTDKPDVWHTFEQYIMLCKRVMEIGYVNRIGDIELANAAVDSRP